MLVDFFAVLRVDFFAVFRAVFRAGFFAAVFRAGFFFAAGLRRAAVRGFHTLGGDATREMLGSIVLEQDRYDVQAQALVLMFVMGATRNDPDVQQILEAHPDKRIRKIITEGIDFNPFGDSHTKPGGQGH